MSEETVGLSIKSLEGWTLEIEPNTLENVLSNQLELSAHSFRLESSENSKSRLESS